MHCVADHSSKSLDNRCQRDFLNYLCGGHRRWMTSLTLLVFQTNCEYGEEIIMAGFCRSDFYAAKGDFCPLGGEVDELAGSSCELRYNKIEQRIFLQSLSLSCFINKHKRIADLRSNTSRTYRLDSWKSNCWNKWGSVNSGFPFNQTVRFYSDELSKHPMLLILVRDNKISSFLSSPFSEEN